MEVSLSHSEVDQRADELARLVLLRSSVASKQATARATLKAEHEKVLEDMDDRINKLAGAVRNQREDADAQLSMKFEVLDPGTSEPADPDKLADEIAEAEADGAQAAEDLVSRGKKKKSRGRKGRKGAEAQA